MACVAMANAWGRQFNRDVLRARPRDVWCFSTNCKESLHKLYLRVLSTHVWSKTSLQAELLTKSKHREYLRQVTTTRTLIQYKTGTLPHATLPSHDAPLTNEYAIPLPSRCVSLDQAESDAFRTTSSSRTAPAKKLLLMYMQLFIAVNTLQAHVFEVFHPSSRTDRVTAGQRRQDV
jgi:hypothetical protein